MGELMQFIEAAKRAGASDEFLVTLLEDSLWPRKAVLSAFRVYYSQLTGIPLPARTTTAEASRDAFLYLLAFSTLSTWATAVGSMMFYFSDKWFYDAVFTPVFQTQSKLTVTSSMAAILVAYPLYLFVMRAIANVVSEHPERLNSPVRKWLTYLALLIAAGFVIGDGVTLLNYLLRGEITGRFLTKVATIFVLAGGIFAYYLGSLKVQSNE